MSRKNITLQTRGVSIETKERAEKKAQKGGFENLQDFVRYVVERLADDEDFFIKKSYTMSPALEKEVARSMKDYKEGRYIVLKTSEDINEHYKKLFSELNGEQIRNSKNKLLSTKRKITRVI